MLVAFVDDIIQRPGEGQTTKTICVKNPTGRETTEYPLKRIYTKPPHILADNFFSSNLLMEWLGRKGYGMTTTCACDRILPSLKPYTHHLKVQMPNPRAKAMR